MASEIGQKITPALESSSLKVAVLDPDVTGAPFRIKNEFSYPLPSVRSGAAQRYHDQYFPPIG